MNTPSNVFECKNCGHPIPEATDTCGSCGYNPLQSYLKSFREDTKYSSIVGMVIGGVIIVISFVVPELYEGGSIGFLSQGIGWVVLGFNGYAQFKKPGSLAPMPNPPLNRTPPALPSALSQVLASSASFSASAQAGPVSFFR